MSQLLVLSARCFKNGDVNPNNKINNSKRDLLKISYISWGIAFIVRIAIAEHYNRNMHASKPRYIARRLRQETIFKGKNEKDYIKCF